MTRRVCHPRRWTAEQDAALRACYREHTRGSITRLSGEWGIPISTLANRAARVLQIQPTRRICHPRRWTAAEDALLIEQGYLPARLLAAKLAAAGFPRSVHSLENRRSELRRWGAPITQNDDALTLSEVASGLGCSEETVGRWIHRGWLKARALCPDGRGKRYQITYAALRRFCLDYTVALIPFRPDLVWYTDLIGRPTKG